MRRASHLIAVVVLLCGSWTARAQTSADWQQRVEYDMEVSLLADRHRMEGHQRLVYHNNSPDTLRRVFYHLYFNAFDPHSMMAERNRQLPDPDSRVVPTIFDLGPDEVGFHRIESLHQNGEPVEYEINDTVMQVDLAEPIAPGESATFEMQFHSQVPLQTRRSGRDNLEGIDYSMSQWYPKIAEYDERGWHADPYVGREFYAPFGTFDVDITIPAEYTVGGTGVLQNAEEVGHGYEGNGNNRYRPGSDSYAEDDSVTWRFHAENVHDFAWAADPDYIHDQFEGPSGTTYHLLYQPNVEEQWQPMHNWVPAIVQYYSDQFGSYPYPQFTVAQAGDGGMEYPMVNFITGRRGPQSLLGVTAHEAAHEWFYGVLANNEADYAWMDEGFTSYATTEAVAHITGRPADHTGARLNVLYLQDLGLFERLNTPADWFTTNIAYGIAAYPAGEMFVDMLGYVISDELRSEWLQAYYRRFKFGHPNPYDLEVIAEDISGLRLDWYFEQFLNTTRTLDYALEDLDVSQSGESWQTEVVIEREDEVVMPVDLRLTYADGTRQWVNIPLSIMEGHKPVPESWIVAEPWFWTDPDYTFSADLPKRVVRAEIDPRGEMPDENRLNNTSGFPLQARFLQPPRQSWFQYSVGFRPLAQYANDFGVGAGMQARGQYLFGEHRLRTMLKLWPQVIASGGDEPALTDVTEEDLPPFSNLLDFDTSFFDGIDYELSYTREVNTFGPEATATLTAQKHLGLLENRLALTKPLASPLSAVDRQVSVSLVQLYNPTDRVFGTEGLEMRNSSGETIGEVPLNLFYRQHMLSVRLDGRVADGLDRLSASLEVGSSLKTDVGVGGRGRAPSASATHFVLDAVKSVGLGRLTGRAQLRFGLGTENLAVFKRFRLGAASFEGRWQNDAFRSAAAAFDDPLETAHLAAFQGAGPVAYLREGLVNVSTIGRHILAGTLALQTPNDLFGNAWLRPLQLELFSGAGKTWSSGGVLDEITRYEGYLADAGAGVSYDVSALSPLSRWTNQSDVLSGLKLQAKFPIWASDPKIIDPEQDPFSFRWLVGIQTGL